MDSIATQARLFRAGTVVVSLAAVAAAVADDRGSPARGECLVELMMLRHDTGERSSVVKAFDSGRIEAGSPTGRGKCMVQQVPPKEVRALAAEVEKAILMGKLTTSAIADEVQREAERTGLAAAIEGADEAVLVCQTARGREEVRCSAIGVLAERYPEAKRVQAFAAIQQRLLNIAAIAQAGGREAAQRLAAAATREMQAEHPDAKAWGVEELSMVRAGEDGGRMIQFCRRVASTNDPHTYDCWITMIVEKPGEELRVSVLAPESVVR